MSNEYIALSYVWGAPNSDECPRRTTGVLPSNVARVVQDALVVVLALGKRYLWVDKYCVEQRDHAIKRVQIQNMDQIYEGAHATIIVCAGSDASFGLPGVSGVMRYRQPSAEIENLLLLSSLPPLSSALADSTWITRGWTYQEAIVSRRCLFFTPWQVYFVCRSMSCSEAIVNGLSDRVERPQKTATTLSVAEVFGLWKEKESFRPKKSLEFRELADHITAYTSRRLTYRDDALNTFRGVLKRSPFPTYFGIPIAPRDASGIVEGAKALDIGFARGLYWLPLYRGGHRISLSRCSKFPSWSWAGWEGSVEYCQKTGPLYGVGEGGFMEVERESFDIAFWVEDTDQKPHSLKDLWKSTHGTKIIPELSNYLIINAQVFQFGFKPGEYGRLVCSTHDGLPPARDAFLEPIFCQKPTEEMYQRLITESWDCVLLFKSIDSSNELYNLMIVERIGDVAQRIGTITVIDSNGTFSRLLRNRQRVRIV